jgi:amino acid permease
VVCFGLCVFDEIRIQAGYLLSSIFLIGGAFGACVSYSVIVGDTIPTTFAAFLGPDSFFAQVVSTVFRRFDSIRFGGN